MTNSKSVANLQAPQEPPRVCPQCGRWMVVQIVPHGWWTICSRHGKTTSWGQQDSESVEGLLQ